MQSKADLQTDTILVRAPNWIGDCIMSVASIHRLRAQYPESRIDLLCRPLLRPIFTLGAPHDSVFTAVMGKRGERIWATAAKIREQGVRYDLGLLLTNSLSTALEFCLAGVRRRVGYARDGRSLLLSDALKEPNDCHQIERYGHLLSPLSSEPFEYPQPLLRIPDTLKASLERRLEALGLAPFSPYLVVAPCAAYGRAKRWPGERFHGLITSLMLRHPRLTLVGLGAPAERGEIETLFAGVDRERSLNLAGDLSLDLSFALIAGAACVVANDSGLMHAAWGLGTPLVALFGPNDPRVTGPRSPQARVIYKGAECSPCSHRHCPIDHRCMRSISVDEVVESVSGQIAGSD